MKWAFNESGHGQLTWAGREWDNLRRRWEEISGRRCGAVAVEMQSQGVVWANMAMGM